MIAPTTVRNIISIDRNVILCILGMAVWGGIVRRVMMKQGKLIFRDVSALLGQLVLSSFTGFLLSLFMLSRNASDDKVLMYAGFGGVFAGPLMTLITKRLAAYTEKFSGTVLQELPEERQELGK